MAESLAEQARPNSSSSQRQVQRVGRRSCLPWTLTSASWTPGGGDK